MKKLFLILLLAAAVTSVVYSQNNPSDWKTDEDFKKAEPVVIEKIAWIEEHPIEATQEENKITNAFVLYWFTEVKYIQLNINTDIFLKPSKEEYKYGSILGTLFMFGKGRFLIQNGNTADDISANVKGIETMITAYNNILKKEPDETCDAMDKFVKMQKNNKLEAYVKKNTK
jgi:hypothetical protein